MTIELTDPERDILLDLLDRELASLGPELHHTRSMEYRQELKAEKGALAKLAERLRHTQAA